MRRKVCREKTCFLSLRARVGCGIMFQYVQIVQTYRMEQTDTSVPHGEEGFKMKEFYRVSEVMVILNLGRTKTYDLIRAGVIPSAYIDGSLRVPVKLLHEKIETIISASRRCESIIAQPPPLHDSPIHNRLASQLTDWLRKPLRSLLAALEGQMSAATVMNQCGRDPTADLRTSATSRISLPIAEPGDPDEVRPNTGRKIVARRTGDTAHAITPGLIVLNRASGDADQIREWRVLLENPRLDLKAAGSAKMRSRYIQSSARPALPHAAPSLRAVVVGHTLATVIIRTDRFKAPALPNVRKVQEGTAK